MGCHFPEREQGGCNEGYQVSAMKNSGSRFGGLCMVRLCVCLGMLLAIAFPFRGHAETEEQIKALENQLVEMRVAAVRKALAEKNLADAQAKLKELQKLVGDEDARYKEMAGLLHAASESAVSRQPDMEPVPGLKMKWLPPGTFRMGSPIGERGRTMSEKVHQVTISRGFWIGVYEVTQGQWKAVMKSNPSHFKSGDDYPVENVSWNDVKQFCERLNETASVPRPAGYVFDLPTEAQWEYASRAGTDTALNSGKDLSDEKFNCENLNEVGWYDYKHENSSTHPVGKKRPNAWGLYDMHGNVCEWCRDWWGVYLGDAIDPKGPKTGSMRGARGGSWGNSAQICRSAYRSNRLPDQRTFFLGFRLALVPQD